MRRRCLVPMYITSDLSGFSSNPFWLNQACNAVTHCWRVAKEAVTGTSSLVYNLSIVSIVMVVDTRVVDQSSYQSDVHHVQKRTHYWSLRYTKWNVHSRWCRCTDTDCGWTSCEVRCDPVPQWCRTLPLAVEWGFGDRQLHNRKLRPINVLGLLVFSNNKERY